MPYNAFRLSHVNVKDAIRDPNITIRIPERSKKRLEYVEGPRKSTIEHDKISKEIHDYTGNPIIKLDVDPKPQMTAKHWM